VTGPEYGVRLRDGLIAPAASAAYAIGYGRHLRVATRDDHSQPWRVLTPAEVRAIRAAEIPDCARPSHAAIDRHQRSGQALCCACCDWHSAYETRRNTASGGTIPPPPLVAAYTWDWPRINAAIAGVLA
jgi:hypothetical protein